MSRVRYCLAVAVALGAGAVALAQPQPARGLAPDQLRSGLSFAGPDVQRLQADAFANPGLLWLTRGEALWGQAAGPLKHSCQDCHGRQTESMRGVAARYPRLAPNTGQLVNLEDQIRTCRTQRQRATDWAFESDELLAMALYVTEASRGLPLQMSPDPQLGMHLQAGAALYQGRQGQLNLSCAQCHDQQQGRRLYSDRLSQGQPNGYPVYRLEWQTLGSLERRLRSCYAGIRAEPPPWGDLRMRQLALYLTWRGEGLPIEVPAVRK
jgi:sulfur-oxidizing protein SoxA